MKKKLQVTLSLVLILALLFTSGLVSAKENDEKVLKMATNSTFPPYEFIEDGKIVGIDVEIANELAKRLGYDLQIMDMEFNTIIAAIESGKANISLAGLTITEDRKEKVNFSIPYAKSVQIVIVAKDSEIDKLDDLEGKKIGTQLGTTGDIYAKDDFGEEAVQSFDKYADAILALKSDKIDLVMIDQMTGQEFLKSNSDLKALDSPYADEEYAIAVSKDEPQLLEKIDEIILAMKEDKSLDKIISKYISSEDSLDMAEGQGLIDQIKNNLVEKNRWMYLTQGLQITLIVTFFSLLIGFVLGLIIALIKLLYKDKKPAWNSPGKVLLNISYAISSVFVSFIRGTPTMIQLLIMFNIILAGVNNLIIVATLTFGLNSAAYMSEIFRGGFNAVNKGEIEAARALGLSYYQTFKKIVLPQSLHLSLPALGNETITLLKETSIAGAIGLMDLTRGANIIISNTYSALIPYLATAFIYYIFVLILEKLFKKLEGKMNYAKN
ncbi:MAG: transporter substrate-binding domain-containing protein [Tissierellia bacterium]|nr:transporter substrate-binding domain-containing protein [Tissierellia bacterium]